MPARQPACGGHRLRRLTVKALLTRAPRAALAASQTRINDRVRAVFERVPLLIGFSLGADLTLADLEVETWPGAVWPLELYAAIDGEISALVSEFAGDEASELLRGRTFARSLH
jgi:hypothetical protein